jgi:hypothetical protein
MEYEVPAYQSMWVLRMMMREAGVCAMKMTGSGTRPVS